MKRILDLLFPKVTVCEYCSKSDKVEINYVDWCDRCKKILIGKQKRKFMVRWRNWVKLWYFLTILKHTGSNPVLTTKK